MEGIIPYLTFDGRTREAIEFYNEVFNGNISMMQTFGESPMDCPEVSKERIMHAVLESDALKIMASDTMHPLALTAGENISLSLNFHDAVSIKQVFENLSKDGKITMALEETFWGATFGMCTDKFGIHWMVNFDHPAEEKK